MVLPDQGAEGQEPQHPKLKDRLRNFELRDWLANRRADNMIYVWLAVPVILVAFYGIGAGIAGLSFGKTRQWDRWWRHIFVRDYIFPHEINSITDVPAAIWNASGWFWAWVVLTSGASIGLWNYLRVEATDVTRRRERTFHIAMSLVTLVASLQFIGAVWNDDKDAGRFNTEANVFVFQDVKNSPESAQKLMDGAKPSNKPGCIMEGAHDVPSCITEGSLEYHWDDRTGSANGAEKVLTTSTVGTSNTRTMAKSLVYIHGTNAKDGMWTAVREGKGSQPNYGVVRMDKNNKVSSCDFTGNFKLNHGFSGSWGHNLRGLMAKDYPQLMWHDEDVWGDCIDGTNEPVVVICVTKFTNKNSRAVQVAAGIVTVRGSANGETVLKYYPSVKAGQALEGGFKPRGPVYANTLAWAQTESTQWQAGRGNRSTWHATWGYDPLPTTDNDDNVTNHLRRAINPDGSLGGLYWVTLLTARNTKDRTVIAMAITPADSVERGKLNTQRILAYNNKRPGSQDTNPDIVNIEQLEKRIKEQMSRVSPGYFSSGGSVVEFIPRDNSTWLAFGEFDGWVKYRFEIKVGSAIAPTIFDLETGEQLAGSTPKPEGAVCFDPKLMTPQEAGICLTAIGDQLKNYKPPVASPSGSPTPVPSHS